MRCSYRVKEINKFKKGEVIIYDKRILCTRYLQECIDHIATRKIHLIERSRVIGFLRLPTLVETSRVSCKFYRSVR